MVLLSIIRISGAKWYGKFDMVWQVFWHLLAAEIGMILTAMSSFRALYVLRAREKRDLSPSDRAIKVFGRVLGVSSRLANSFRIGARLSEMEAGGSAGFPSIPAATMTGMRTFIDGYGEES